MLDEQLRSEFRESWDRTLAAYREHLFPLANWRWIRPMEGVINAMRAMGYDQVFRAGTSVHRLVISRSRKHGLTTAQPYILLFPFPTGELQVTVFLGGQETTFRLDTIAMHKELEDSLARLAHEPIS